MIGGALMLLIAVVTVELGIAAPKTGGLLFLPLQAAGPLLATIVAAGLWITYAAHPASEAAAVANGLERCCTARKGAVYRASATCTPAYSWR